MRITNKRAVAAALLATGGLLMTACGSNSSHTSSPTTSGSSGTTASGGGSGGSASTTATTVAPAKSTTTVAPTTASSFTLNFSAMTALKSLASAGSGKIGVILPDTTSSNRYVDFDQPYLERSFKAAGLPKSDYTVQNAQASDATALTDAKADITNGAKVLLIDPEDPAGGVAIEKYAKQHGVASIDYDRLTLGGSRDYYVSFNNVQVGHLIGEGLVSCVNAWHVSHPDVVVMKGAPTDNNATLFAQGYDAVLAPYFKSGKWKLAASPAGTWTPSVALTEFKGALTSNKGINGALIPNDENAAPIIAWLQSQSLKAKTFPTTGQDATLEGLQNILSGYECGTAYKPIYEEAQAAAALALYLRAGKTPPKGLLNGKSLDPTEHVKVPSVLLTPEWVTPTNMASTVVKDNFVSAKQLCAGKYGADCKQYGISG
ncbi:MAG TPA: substrate-binding domain-containing protein [Acidimicrobiales bacterium]|nr:substrate-binding domain-containing protein [Acidimicrobiales bacterium]